MQLFVAQDVQLGTGLTVFESPEAQPNDPCRAVMQVRLTPPDPVKPLQIVVDPAVAPDRIDTQIVFESLAAYRPALERCAAPSVDLP